MGRKILVNNSGQNLSVDLITRVGGDPSNTGPTVTVQVNNGGRIGVDYPNQFLNGIGVKVVDRGSAWDDVMNTNNTLTFTGNFGNLTITGSNS